MKNIFCSKSFDPALFLYTVIVFVLTTLQVNAQIPPVPPPVCAYCDIPLNAATKGSDHKPWCPYYVAPSTDNGTSSRSRGITFTKPIQSGVQGAILSSLAGGLLVKGKSGEELWLEGAAFGYGIFSSISLLSTLNKRSLGENIALAVIAGSANGYAEATLKMAFTEPTAPVKPDNTIKSVVTVAIIETVVVAVATISLTKKTKGGYSYKMNKNNFLSKMNVNFYGNRIGLMVKL